MGMSALEEIDEACLVTTLEVPALHDGIPQADLRDQWLLRRTIRALSSQGPADGRQAS